MKKSYEIPKLGDQVEYLSPLNHSIITGTVVEGFVVRWSDEPDDVGSFMPGERYRIVPKKEKTPIEIDFTGEELVEMGRECKKMNLTFSEFIDFALKKALIQNND